MGSGKGRDQSFWVLLSLWAAEESKSGAYMAAPFRSWSWMALPGSDGGLHWVKWVQCCLGSPACISFEKFFRVVFTSMTLFCCLYCYFSTDFTYFSGASILELQQVVNAGFRCRNLMQFLTPSGTFLVIIKIKLKAVPKIAYQHHHCFTQ